jgi:UDP-glucose 4-epimerase
VPLPAIGFIAEFVRRTARLDFTADQLRLLNFGRVVDASALRDEFGYAPAYTTESAYANFLTERGRTDPMFASSELVDRFEQTLRSFRRLVRHG